MAGCGFRLTVGVQGRGGLVACLVVDGCRAWIRRMERMGQMPYELEQEEDGSWGAHASFPSGGGRGIERERERESRIQPSLGLKAAATDYRPGGLIRRRPVQRGKDLPPGRRLRVIGDARCCSPPSSSVPLTRVAAAAHHVGPSGDLPRWARVDRGHLRALRLLVGGLIGWGRTMPTLRARSAPMAEALARELVRLGTWFFSGWTGGRAVSSRWCNWVRALHAQRSRSFIPCRTARRISQ